MLCWRLNFQNELDCPSYTFLQIRVIKAAHHLRHLEMTKIKRMLREKYWFPTMNTMVEQIIGEYFECQITRKQHNQEPVKPIVTPGKPWDIIAVDFGWPLQFGSRNLRS